MGDVEFDSMRVRLVQDLGFGFTTLDPSLESDLYAQEYIDCLVDWGWSNPAKQSPPWYQEANRDAG